VTFKRWDVVRMTFPYLEGHDAKKRPALIVSTEALAASHKVLWAVMITTAKGGTLPEDIAVTDPVEAGLVEDCVIRPSRLFTVSADLLDRRLGSIKPRDRNAVAAFLKKHMP
jgi:mRNA-degrading endonuclease toxin of MazEF toxin-antitoxin module